jgi:hypothetical protein
MMKRHVAILVAFLVLGFSSMARASLFADFWAVDANHDGVTTLDLNLFTAPASLWFSTDEINWALLFNSEAPLAALSSKLTLKGTTHLYLQLDNPFPAMVKVSALAAAPATTPTVTYNGQNSLFIQWGGKDNLLPLSFITPEGKDIVASNNPVPIPTAALLFGTGLMGFIGIRRKKLL